MKNFIVENWFKLVLSVCLLICSVGFLMQSSRPVQAQAAGRKAVGGFLTNNGKAVIVWSDGVITWPTRIEAY